ncbi:MAG: hypothetical protein ACRD5L_04520, partial [Bryobacteraceae bacterium]
DWYHVKTDSAMVAFSQRLADEAGALCQRLGFNSGAWLRTTLTHLAVVGLFGVFLPWQKGVGFLDPVILGAYACFGVVFAGPASAHDAKNMDPLARILVCVLYGEFLVLGMLFTAIAILYTTHRIYVGPDLESLAMCGLFGLALSLAVSTIAVWMSFAYSPSAARSVVRLVFLALLAAFFFRSRRLPAVASWGAGIALAVAIIAYLRLRAALLGANISERE